MKVSAEELKWSSLWEEKACLDCFITENRPEVGLERLLELSAMSYGSTPGNFKRAMNARMACKLIEIRVSRIMEELKEIEKP